MGRKIIQLKKIEKAAARHVAFSKRRKGLVKKAQELSVMCDADVGVVVFSATGKLFHYSNTGMEMILKKYSESFPGILNIQLQLDNQDLGRTKQEIENINCNLRHMHGEDLQGLTVKDLQKLEQMMEVGLHRIQSTKGKQIEEENARLCQELKRHSNLENNTALEFSLIEASKNRDQPQLSESIHNSYSPMSLHKISTQHNEVSDTSLQLG